MQPELTIRLKRLDERAIAPAYHSEHAAGMDLSACLPRGAIEAESVTLAPRGGMAKIPLGFAVEIPHGYEGQVRPRSGLATKFGVTIPNSPGTVDSDYRGEMFVALINLGPEPYEVRHADRIAQLVIARVHRAELTEVEELTETARAGGGFGSTGR